MSIKKIYSKPGLIKLGNINKFIIGAPAFNGERVDIYSDIGNCSSICGVSFDKTDDPLDTCHLSGDTTPYAGCYFTATLVDQT
jgi:hypothetical protein